MRIFIFILLLLSMLETKAQNLICETCDTTITLSGAQFGSGKTYQWTCSDGQTSTAQNPTFDVDSLSFTCSVIVTDTLTGCTIVSGVEIKKCWQCIASVYITVQNTTLLAATANCQAQTPFYTWERYLNNAWQVVRRNASSYDAGNNPGLYRVTADCGFGCTAVDSITYAGPCGAMSVKLQHVVPIPGYVNGAIKATVTGCSGSIKYTYYRQVLWLSGYGPFPEFENTSTAKTDSIPAGTWEPYKYKVIATCGACIDSTEIISTVQPPCSQGSATLTATATNFAADQRVSFNMAVWVGRGINSNGPYYNLQHYYGPGYAGNRNLYSGTSNRWSNVSFWAGNHRIILTATSQGCTFLDTVDLVVTQASCDNFLTTYNSNGIQGCSGQEMRFEGSAAGGTAPYTWNWTARLGSGAPFSLGSANQFGVILTSLGAYTVTMTVTDANGCVSTKTGSVTVIACDCQCDGSLALLGCQLYMTFSGRNCQTAFNYSLEYSANNGNTWSVVVPQTAIPTTNLAGYSPTVNGIYRLKLWQKTEGCVTKEYLPVNVSCYVPPCTLQPTLTLNGTGQQFCGVATATVSGNTFGGSATSVTLSENGAGSLNIATANSSPFTFVYTPDASDVGKIITITVTTNNPNGGLCLAQTKTYALDFRLFITPQVIVGDTLCYNTQRSLSGYPAGGTFSATGAGVISNGNILTSTAGYGPTVVTYTVTTNGCTGSSSATVYNSYCCNCTPAALTLNADGCSMSYGTCANWVAQMQIDTAQNGNWVNYNSYEVMKGFPTYPYNFRESANYRVRYTNTTCQTKYSNTLSVSGGNIVSYTTNYQYDIEDLSGSPANFWATCLLPGDRLIYGLNPAGAATNGNFYTNTFTSAIPVTWNWEYLNGAPTENMTVQSTTSTAITFRYQWVGGASYLPNLCVPGGGTGRYFGRLTATDGCGKLVYRVYIVGSVVG
jgi:hypothetical protein